MNDLSRYKNNILYITKDTKLPKSAYNSSFVPINNLPIKQRKIYINNSEEKKTNEKNNKIFLSISNIKPLSNHQRILTFNNNKDKIYNYKFLPRKNIMHIKSYSSQKENFPLTSYSSKKNVSISYTSPKKNTRVYISNDSNNNSNNRKNISYIISDSSHGKTACSSYKKIEIKKTISIRNNIKAQNLIQKFNEETKNKRRIINYKVNRVKELNNKDKNDSNKTSLNKIKYITQLKEEKLKKKERRERITANLLRNVTKVKCSICHKLLNHYIYQMHISCHPSQIFPWLYLGDYMNANNNEELKLLKIKYILNCACEIKIFNLPSNIKYHKLDLIDNLEMNIGQYFEEAFAFIELARKNKENILVHCKLGRSRSTSILIAYMVKYMGYNVKKAMEFIQSKRKQIKPNYGFIKQLYAYERYLNSLKNSYNNYDNNCNYNYNYDYIDNNYICW